MRKLSFSLGKYITVFQAEVYAIKARAVQEAIGTETSIST
jgi:hypothetical protein